MKQQIVSMRHIASALVFTAIAGASLAAHSQQVVKIGFTSPLSGPQVGYGDDNRNGLLLAVKELNAKGVQVGQQKVQFEAVLNDDGADPRQGVSVAQKMADEKIKYVIGPYNSGVAIPASRVYNDAGMLLLTVASNPRVTQQGYTRLFRVGASDSQLGSKMAVYAAKEMKIKNVAVIDDRTTYGQGLADEFVAEAGRQGLNIVSKQFTTDKATDFSAILTAIRAAKPDAIFYGGYSSQAGPLARQMVGLGMTTKLLGGDGICSSETSKLSGGVADKLVLCTQGGGMLDKAEAGRAFTAKYRAEYKQDPLTYAVAFYDAAMLLADAMQKTGSTDPGKLAEYMAKSSYKGVAGEYSFTDKHDLKSSAVTVYGFKDGQPVPLLSL